MEFTTKDPVRPTISSHASPRQPWMTGGLQWVAPNVRIGSGNQQGIVGRCEADVNHRWIRGMFELEVHTSVSAHRKNARSIEFGVARRHPLADGIAWIARVGEREHCATPALPASSAHIPMKQTWRTMSPDRKSISARAPACLVDTLGFVTMILLRPHWPVWPDTGRNLGRRRRLGKNRPSSSFGGVGFRLAARSTTISA